jgi:hypothetical protein
MGWTPTSSKTPAKNAGESIVAALTDDMATVAVMLDVEPGGDANDDRAKGSEPLSSISVEYPNTLKTMTSHRRQRAWAPKYLYRR